MMIHSAFLYVLFLITDKTPRVFGILHRVTNLIVIRNEKIKIKIQQLLLRCKLTYYRLSPANDPGNVYILIVYVHFSSSLFYFLFCFVPQ